MRGIKLVLKGRENFVYQKKEGEHFVCVVCSLSGFSANFHSLSFVFSEAKQTILAEN